MPHEGARALLDREQISYDGMKARQVKPGDFRLFDYIIVMDEQNMLDLMREYDEIEKPVLAKLMDFVVDNQEVDVPDPYYIGDFEYTYELVLNGTNNLLTHIRAKHDI